MTKVFRHSFWIFAMLLRLSMGDAVGEGTLPAFGRDTVLVWQMRNLDHESQFVVRIAEFEPDRFVEWEDMKTQGTIFMPAHDLAAAKNYVSANLFQSGVDSQGKRTTTLWLSRRIYGDLTAKGKAKCDLDGVAATLTRKGKGRLAVEVNKSVRELPVIIVADDRGSERWFLDSEENPLLVKHTLRTFTQVLTSITTDRTNALRWIKGNKLKNPPR